MAKRIVLICDKCEDPNKPVSTYAISEGKRRVRIELCAEDARALESFLPGKPGRPSAQTGPTIKPAPGRPRGGRKAAPSGK